MPPTRSGSRQLLVRVGLEAFAKRNERMDAVGRIRETPYTEEWARRRDSRAFEDIILKVVGNEVVVSVTEDAAQEKPYGGSTTRREEYGNCETNLDDSQKKGQGFRVSTQPVGGQLS